jgi:hypothetical protein
VLPAAFETESFRTRRQAIDEEIEERHEAAFRALGQEAQEKGVALIHTPTGFVLAPVRNEEVLTPEQFEKLPLAEQQQLTTRHRRASGEAAGDHSARARSGDARATKRSGSSIAR